MSVADSMASRITGRPRHGPSTSANPVHRSDQAPSTGLTVISPAVVVVSRVQPHEERSRPEDGLGGVAPLDQGHPAVVDQLAQSQVDDLVEVVEPVDVGVQEDPHRGRAVHRVLRGPG